MCVLGSLWGYGHVDLWMVPLGVLEYLGGGMGGSM